MSDNRSTGPRIVTTVRHGALAGPVRGGSDALPPTATQRATPSPAAASLPVFAGPRPVVVPDPAREILDGLSEAVVTVDSAGVVGLVNTAAAALLPEVAAGARLDRCEVGPLAGAARSSTGQFDGEHRGRHLRGTSRTLADGRRVWYVRDVTHTRDNEEQLRLARILQATLLPPELPAIPGVTLASGYRAAQHTLRIGGDFYDVSATGNGGAFALGDVCGKGLGAAVLTGRVRQSLHTLRLLEDRPLRLIQLLNRGLCSFPDAVRRAQFTTLLLGAFTVGPDGGLRLRIAGGGHPPPLLLRADGTVTPVLVGGMPVGALAAASFAETTLRMVPGDRLLTYTDGVTEARGGRGGSTLFGEARLAAVLGATAELSPVALIDRLLRIVDEWRVGQHRDDIALLVIEPAGRRG